jgi:hypothetical protein
MVGLRSVGLLAVASKRLSAAAGGTIGMKERIHGIRGHFSRHPRSARWITTR